jgi:hypothetical protein
MGVLHVLANSLVQGGVDFGLGFTGNAITSFEDFADASDRFIATNTVNGLNQIGDNALRNRGELFAPPPSNAIIRNGEALNNEALNEFLEAREAARRNEQR